MITASGSNLELLLEIRETLFDAIRSEDCPIKERAPITRQIRLNEHDVAELDDSMEQLKLQYDLLVSVRSILKDTLAEGCPFGYLAMLTRQLKDISKEIDTLAEQLKHEEGLSGGTSSEPSGSFSIDDI